MSRIHVLATDSNVVADQVLIYKETHVHWILDSNTVTETLDLTDLHNPMGDGNVVTEKLCFRLIRKLRVSDSNAQIERVSPVFRWDDPRNGPPPPPLVGTFAPVPSTKSLTKTESNVQIEILIVKRNGVLVGPTHCA